MASAEAEQARTVLTNLRRLVESAYAPSRERSLAVTKLDEAELWLTRCEEATT